MSQTSKIVIGIAVAAVVLAGAYYYWQTTQSGTRDTQATEEVTTLPTGTNSSDTSLDTDINAIDSQIQAVGTDNANVDASVSAVSPQ